MTPFLLEVRNIRKTFGRKVLFEKISFDVRLGESFAVTGKNGSGKSTLMKVICGVLTPNGGTVRYVVNGTDVPLSEVAPHIGLVSPYLNMYEEFTGEENLRLFAKIRGIGVRQDDIHGLLQRFGIYEHRNKEARFYSSGMKQRLKYCAALLHRPALLFLDEPTANLDDIGISVVRDVMREQRQRASLVFATNETEDLSFADRILDLTRLKIG